jgi:hypothetical protein
MASEQAIPPEKETLNQILDILIEIEKNLTEFYNDFVPKIEIEDFRDAINRLNLQDSIQRINSLGKVGKITPMRHLDLNTIQRLEKLKSKLILTLKKSTNPTDRAIVIEKKMGKLYNEMAKRMATVSPYISDMFMVGPNSLKRSFRSVI